MRIERVTVNKQVAEEWLARNIERNRSVSRSRVKRLAGDMSSGLWKRTGETIKFDRAGHLVDGQHRLNAVKEADITIDFDVAYDLAEDAVNSIDQGRARSASDVLYMNGEVAPKVLAAAAKIALNYLEGFQPTYGRTVPQIMRFVETFPTLREMAARTEGLYGVIPPSPFIAVTFLGAADGTREKAIDGFIEGVRTGANLVLGDPRLALRTSVQNAKNSSTGARVLDPAFVFQVTTRAWNAYVEDRTITTARYQRASKKKGFVATDIRGGPRAGQGVGSLREALDKAMSRRVLERSRM